MNTNKRNKIAGAIYGFAIGDAMGATTEFMNKKKIKRRYGKVKNIIGGGWLNLKPGDVTDDTQMTMCVMDALMNTLNKKDAFGYLFMKECRLEFIKWYKTMPRDVGGQCSKAIIYMMTGKLGMYHEDDALGNGSLMRAMPCALLDKELLNELQSRMTHNNEACTGIVKTYSILIQNHLNGKSMGKVIKRLLEPSGHVVNTFNNSVYWSQQETFEEAIIGAVNDGGDADTIAAITGSIAGARFGYDAIPKEWLDELNPHVKTFLEKFKNFVFSYLQI